MCGKLWNSYAAAAGAANRFSCDLNRQAAMLWQQPNIVYTYILYSYVCTYVCLCV